MQIRTSLAIGTALSEAVLLNSGATAPDGLLALASFAGLNYVVFKPGPIFTGKLSCVMFGRGCPRRRRR